MVPRDGAGLHALCAMLLVISLLYPCHSFIRDFWRASSGMAVSKRKRKRAIIWPTFGCSWLEERAQETPENLGCQCYLEKEWGQQPMLLEEVATTSHTPTARWSPASQTLEQRSAGFWCPHCVQLCCVVPTQSKTIDAGVVLVAKSLLLQLRKLLWNHIGFEETCTQQNSSNFTHFRAVEHPHRHTTQPYTHVYSWHPSKRQSPLLHGGTTAPRTTRHLNLIFPIILRVRDKNVTNPLSGLLKVMVFKWFNRTFYLGLNSQSCTLVSWRTDGILKMSKIRGALKSRQYVSRI